MKIVSKLEIFAGVTLTSLAFCNQSALSKNNSINQLENTLNQETEIIVTESAHHESLLVSSGQMLYVNHSLTSLSIPQPLGVLCILGIAGLSSFLKLKIAKVKHNKKVEEKIEVTPTEYQPQQMLDS
ncbi:hypothetical protein [Crocosphaera sp. Alani8]|uniref:hypothetical protein n=1 Tax=Crocosphaera sp. Alani8 TaxID=3038952 RepID=UPI00313F2BE5